MILSARAGGVCDVGLEEFDDGMGTRGAGEWMWLRLMR